MENNYAKMERLLYVNASEWRINMYKNIGIIGALGEEVEELKASIENAQIVTKAGMEFVSGTIGDKNVIVVKSGVGKINAAVCAQILIDIFEVDILINAGVAGSLKNEINIGDIVIAKDVVNHDMDATGFGHALGEVPNMDKTAFETDEKIVDECVKICEKVNPDISAYVGRILTGDQFIADKNKKDWLVNTFDGCCTEMEGVAVGQTAWLNNIPFLVIRAISDKADGSAEVDYNDFKEGAIVHITNLVIALIEEI